MAAIFRFILAITFAAFIAHWGYYNRKLKPVEGDSLKVREPDQNSPFVILLSIVGLVSLLLSLVAPQLIGFAALTIPDWVRWLGVGIAAVGFVLLQWSQITLGKNWSDKPRIIKSQHLITGNLLVGLS